MEKLLIRLNHLPGSPVYWHATPSNYSYFKGINMLPMQRSDSLPLQPQVRYRTAYSGQEIYVS